MRAISPGSLLLRSVGFGRDSAGAWGRRGPACGGGGCLGGPALRAMSPRSLMLRLVCFGEAARVRGPTRAPLVAVAEVPAWVPVGCAV